ncbi:hypothetical protein CXB51_024136 [Gossypium anomalum]|uniref:DUF7745 domain-containing protein n=1 Tax=Gossypium anomalum TaxID=47600 RepID=A0A8J5YUG9_9ROSI|nr:hypothetical protein CXB51_024136 [Gossypium anomalum]
MENEFLDKVKDNAVVRIWSEKTQLEKGDSLVEGCFTFGEVDLVHTVEYTALLRCPKIQADKAYSRTVNVLTFVKKLMNITGISEQCVTALIKQKGESKFINWKTLRDLILAHPDMKKKTDVFALSIYGLIIFPKALGHIDEAVLDLFDRLNKRVTPRENGSRSSKIPKKKASSREPLGWSPDEIMYWCGDFDWVPLLGIWRAIGYAPLLVLRQYRSRQFILATHGLAQCEFSYKGDNYKKKVREMSNVWNQTRRMKRFAVGPMTTPNIMGNRVEESITSSGQVKKALDGWKNTCKWFHPS